MLPPIPLAWLIACVVVVAILIMAAALVVMRRFKRRQLTGVPQHILDGAKQLAGSEAQLLRELSRDGKKGMHIEDLPGPRRTAISAYRALARKNLVDVCDDDFGGVIVKLTKRGRMIVHGLDVRDRLRRQRPYLDENVRFTVYRPKTVLPEKWYPMLAFAHLSERRADAPANEPDPVEEVRRQADRVLGQHVGQYQKTTQDTVEAVARSGEITFVPDVPGIEFNPPYRTFAWQESVHREEFHLKASAELNDKTAKGRLSVFLGSLLLAEVNLSIGVDGSLGTRLETTEMETGEADRFRKIFACYSRKDTRIVEEYEAYALSLGDRYLRDCRDIHAGEVWSDRVAEMIQEADVFQLFWSSNSMHSRFAKQEWEHALSLSRSHFVRPVYWEEPLPECPEKHLPPENLRRLHFQRVHLPWGAEVPSQQAPRNEESADHGFLPWPLLLLALLGRNITTFVAILILGTVVIAIFWLKRRAR